MIREKELESAVSAKLWRYLTPFHYVMRALMTVCGCVSLLFWVILNFNWLYDYLVVAIVLRDGSVWLTAPLIVPFWTFFQCGFLRYFVYGIMAMWNLNVMSSG